MSITPISASCLCGEVRWEVEGPLDFMSHCHCSRCRKAHGAAYGTYVTAKVDHFRLTHGRDTIVRYESSPGSFRPFCGRCGAVVPDGVPWHGRVGMPAGPFDSDPGVRPAAHIFVASKAPWFEIHDAMPRFDAYPPDFDAPVLPALPPIDPPGSGARGSCLCGQVTYVIEGKPIRCRTCHCSRCRKAGSAAHVSYLVTALFGVRFTRGEALLVTYKVPEARYFQRVFCRSCGSNLPRSDREREIGIVPMGTLDDDPGVRPEGHIFVGSKAPWDEIADGLPQHTEYPPS
jgi:hypothetical protein